MGSNNVKDKALNNSDVNAANAANALSTINPIYSQMAQGNMGLTDQQKANALTASGQSLGGGVSSAVGQGGLYAARTGNAGAATAALDDAARQAQVQQSQNALDIQNQSDAIARANQAQGLSGLNQIYAESNGQATANLNTANNAQKPWWQTALAGAAGGAGMALGV